MPPVADPKREARPRGRAAGRDRLIEQAAADAARSLRGGSQEGACPQDRCESRRRRRDEKAARGQPAQGVVRPSRFPLRIRAGVFEALAPQRAREDLVGGLSRQWLEKARGPIHEDGRDRDLVEKARDPVRVRVPGHQVQLGGNLLRHRVEKARVPRGILRQDPPQPGRLHAPAQQHSLEGLRRRGIQVEDQILCPAGRAARIPGDPQGSRGRLDPGQVDPAVDLPLRGPTQGLRERS